MSDAPDARLLRATPLQPPPREKSLLQRTRATSSPLRDRVAVVTGSTSGVGLGVACGLARAGARVMLNGFGEWQGAVDTVVRAAGGKAGRVAYCDADVGREEGVARLLRETSRALGGHCSILVNNAGIQHVAPVDAFPVERWDAIIAVNLSAAFHATRLALPSMRAQRWGRVINIASVHGLVASANKSAYVAAKHGIVGLTKATALECATSGVTCVAICPGWVRTPLVEAQIKQRAEKSGRTLEEEQQLLISEKMPSGTFVEIEHLSETVLFLCSDAASQITGTSIVMDGGWTAQ